MFRIPSFRARLLAGLLAVSVLPALAAPAADVIVIGAGAAGLAAAVSAAECGAKRVVVLEKAPVVGGTTWRAQDGIAAAGSYQQRTRRIHDTAGNWKKGLQAIRGNETVESLINRLVLESASTLSWLEGLEPRSMSYVVEEEDGTGRGRLHHPAGLPAGPEMIRSLYNAAQGRGVDIQLQTRALSLVRDETGRVTGVRAKTEGEEEDVWPARAVVIASGGFASSARDIARAAPEFASLASLAPDGITGDGIAMAEAAGAEIRDQEAVKLLPVTQPDKGIFIQSSVLESGAVLLSRRGERFTDELQDPQSLARDVMKQGEVWLFFDEKVRESNKKIEDYIHTPGVITICPTLERAASEMGIDPEKLRRTVTEYGRMAEKGLDAHFGRTTLPSALAKSPNYYVVPVQAAVAVTSGGIVIDKESRVMRPDGTPVPGLYAAGEAVDGVHADEVTDGTELASAVVFGRIAGINAAHGREKNEAAAHGTAAHE